MQIEERALVAAEAHLDDWILLALDLVVGDRHVVVPGLEKETAPACDQFPHNIIIQLTNSASPFSLPQSAAQPINQTPTPILPFPQTPLK